MKYRSEKEIRIARVRRGDLTDIEQRVYSVVIRAKDGIHKREVVAKSLEVFKTVEFVLSLLKAAGKIGQNGLRGEMARWCKPGLEQHCREVAIAAFYASRKKDKTAEAELRRERRNRVNKEYMRKAKASKELPDTPVRIIGPAREFKPTGPISVFHLAQQ